MTHPNADPFVGRTVAHYEIRSRLGGGGMGVVYQALDRKLGRPVALKFLPPQWSHDASARERFIREAQAASATHHPNICTIHDVETADDGQLFIVMAYYEGETLKRRLEAGPLPIDEALDIATQVADGLARAHAQGVVHRDVKPGNLILTEDGVRIVDFGLATLIDALQITAHGSTLGTAAYMSPEQVKGEATDARTDVWSLGVVLYEMLVGHVPFRGSHAEAVAYAIRHDAAPPLRAERPEVPEEIEQLVFRALHKDRSIRFASGRELARALRQVRGLTVPQDLRTVAVDVRDVAAPPARPRRGTRRLVFAAAALAVALVGAPLWLFYPPDRMPVAVAPVINGSGYPELGASRMALTSEIVHQLVASPAIRVLPYDRLLQILRWFRSDGRDVSSPEALQAVGEFGGVPIVIVPTLLNDNGWMLRADVQEVATGNTLAVVETEPIVSSLGRETAYAQAGRLAALLQRHFVVSGPRRAYVAQRLRELVGAADAAPAARLQTVDAAAAFESGLDAYEQGEYAAARAAFAEAAQHDPRNPLPLAWQSRVAAFMRQDREAADAADRAARLSGGSASPADRLLIEAILAEVRRDSQRAEQRYRALAESYPDDPSWLLELAAFEDRHGDAAAAIATYHRALDADANLSRAHLELCRLYSPSRRNDPARARTHGDAALVAYGAVRNRGGEAQALWCLTDVLRAGSDSDRRQARRHAESALKIMTDLGYPYGIARAENYVAQIAFAERNPIEAAAFWEKSLESARRVGNVFLESRNLLNLGAAYTAMGQRPRALEHYRESFATFETLGSQQEAAWSQANAAAIEIHFGPDPAKGFRDAQNALAVFQKLGDGDWEVFARQTLAAYYRHRGRFDEATRELTLASSLATARGLAAKVGQLTMELARVRVDRGDYPGARQLLEGIAAEVTGGDGIARRRELARVLGRLGDAAAARVELDAASAEARALGDAAAGPLLDAVYGEVAYDAGALDVARAAFERAAAAWQDDLPDAAIVEAQAFLGFIDATRGRRGGRATLVRGLTMAERMGRSALIARCRLLLARVDLAAGRVDDAMRALDPIADAAALAPELRAQIHHWRARILERRGEAAAAGAEAARAAAAIQDLRAQVTDRHAAAVLSRADLRLIR